LPLVLCPCKRAAALQAYQRAIQRAVRQRREQDGEVHVLDIGCGTGILSLMAARAGAQYAVTATATVVEVTSTQGRAALMLEVQPEVQRE
jgi:2-polyprenyl-3-methyl-5-hydroxy-6-metoxy-1,4-benzoquinol methylase